MMNWAESLYFEIQINENNTDCTLHFQCIKSPYQTNIKFFDSLKVATYSPWQSRQKITFISKVTYTKLQTDCGKRLAYLGLFDVYRMIFTENNNNNVRIHI